jgi:hypothetical protein
MMVCDGRWRVVVASAFLCLVTAAEAKQLRAQQDLPIDPGDRLRVEREPILRGEQLSESPPTIGSLDNLQPDTLFLRFDVEKSPLAIARDTITRIERSQGETSSVGKGALIGLGVGAGIGAVFFGAGDGFVSGTSFALFGAVLFGGIGAGAGALIGASSRSEEWEQVYPLVTQPE